MNYLIINRDLQNDNYREFPTFYLLLSILNFEGPQAQ